MTPTPSFDVIGNQHHAQRNIKLVAMSFMKRLRFGLWAANMFEERREFLLEVAGLREARLDPIERRHLRSAAWLARAQDKLGKPLPGRTPGRAPILVTREGKGEKLEVEPRAGRADPARPRCRPGRGRTRPAALRDRPARRPHGRRRRRRPAHRGGRPRGAHPGRARHRPGSPREVACATSCSAFCRRAWPDASRPRRRPPPRRRTTAHRGDRARPRRVRGHARPDDGHVAAASPEPAPRHAAALAWARRSGSSCAATATRCASSTAGSTFDTVVAIYDTANTPTEANRMACDDNGGAGRKSLATR